MNDFKSFINIIGGFWEYKFVQCIILFLISFIVVRLIKFFIKRTLNKIVNNRSETLIRVLGSLVAAIIYFLVFLQILQIIFNIPPSSILAATGVVSVALGFGAQSLVKDVISGFFLLLENQISVGDLVTIDDFTGNIHEMTLRTTIIKNVYGDLFTIPNGSIIKVINHSRSIRGVMIDVLVSYDDDIDKVIDVMNNVGNRAKREISEIVETPEILGITTLQRSGMTVRMFLKCTIGAQFSIEREILKRIKYAFDENQIHIPYEQIVVVDK